MVDDDLERATEWVTDVSKHYSVRNTLGKLGQDDLKRAQRALYQMMIKEYSKILSNNKDAEISTSIGA